MTTGKTEVITNLDAYERGQITLATERDRLEREVIQAVKFWNHAQGEATHVTEVDGTVLTVVRAWNKLRAAVTALEAFEANQK